MKPEIIKALAVTAELTGANLTEAGAEAMVRHLSEYETGPVLEALHRCQVELRGPLTLGAVMDRLDDGHPGPESAWAMVAHLTEDTSVVWTDEIAKSFGLVRNMLHDHVAARMAFLEDYRRRLAKARTQRRRPVWWASLGQDASGRASVLAEAVELGRLPVLAARGMLPPHEWREEWVGVRPALPAAASRDAKALVESLTKKLMAEKRLPPHEGKE
jgi:predicted DNA-binding protein YlxM (UPF0122 family)